MMADRPLLDQSHSESAFRELVARNVDLVYSAATGWLTFSLAATAIAPVTDSLRKPRATHSGEWDAR